MFSSEGIKFPLSERTKEIDTENRYKYFDIFEANGIKDFEMKEMIESECVRQIKKI